MHNAVLITLKSTLLALGVTYLGLMTCTMYFAATQSEQDKQTREAQSAISSLESEYYNRVHALQNTSPSDMKLVKPVSVTYAPQATPPAVSLR